MDDPECGPEDRVGEFVGGSFPLAAPLQGRTCNRPAHHCGLELRIFSPVVVQRQSYSLSYDLLDLGFDHRLELALILLAA
jgi:hypothetical protein